MFNLTYSKFAVFPLSYYFFSGQNPAAVQGQNLAAIQGQNPDRKADHQANQNQDLVHGQNLKTGLLQDLNLEVDLVPNQDLNQNHDPVPSLEVIHGLDLDLKVNQIVTDVHYPCRLLYKNNSFCIIYFYLT